VLAELWALRGMLMPDPATRAERIEAAFIRERTQVLDQLKRDEGWTDEERQAECNRREPEGSYGLCWKYLVPDDPASLSCVLHVGHDPPCSAVELSAPRQAASARLNNAIVIIAFALAAAAMSLPNDLVIRDALAALDEIRAVSVVLATGDV